MEENIMVEVPTEETVFEENVEVETEVEVEVETETKAEVEVTVTEEETEPETSINAEDFENLRQQFEELQNTYNALTESFDTLNNNYNEIVGSLERANEQISNYEAEIGNLNATVDSLNARIISANETINTYEKAAAEAEEVRKNNLVISYEKIISAEEIAPIKEAIADFSYDELESKLAVTFSRKQLKAENEKKVPIVKPEDSSFANLIQKYKKI